VVRIPDFRKQWKTKAPRGSASRSQGRIAFANTDLSGFMDHRSSILEAHRAVEQVLDQSITGIERGQACRRETFCIAANSILRSIPCLSMDF
jgi:hypothetical protein